MVAQTFSSLGYAFDSVIVLFVKDWKWLQLALAICPLPILIVLFLLVDESPKYSAFVLFFCHATTAMHSDGHGLLCCRGFISNLKK